LAPAAFAVIKEPDDMVKAAYFWFEATSIINLRFLVLNGEIFMIISSAE
jgi:hypothetical protein